MKKMFFILTLLTALNLNSTILAAETATIVSDDYYPDSLGYRTVLSDKMNKDSKSGLLSFTFSLTEHPEDVASYRTAFLPTTPARDGREPDLIERDTLTLALIHRKWVHFDDYPSTPIPVYYVGLKTSVPKASSATEAKPKSAQVEIETRTPNIPKRQALADNSKGEKVVTGFFEYSTPKNFSVPKELTDYTVALDYYWGIVEKEGQPPQVFVDERIQVVKVNDSELGANCVHIYARYRNGTDLRLQEVWLMFDRDVESQKIEWYHLPHAHKELKPLADKLYWTIKNNEQRGFRPGPMVLKEIAAGR